ncbi:MAG: hypothetical protein GY817_06365 [bacterium]|nr:hypothetical protein [bacterium]
MRRRIVGAIFLLFFFRVLIYAGEGIINIKHCINLHYSDYSIYKNKRNTEIPDKIYLASPRSLIKVLTLEDSAYLSFKTKFLLKSMKNNSLNPRIYWLGEKFAALIDPVEWLLQALDFELQEAGYDLKENRNKAVFTIDTKILEIKAEGKGKVSSPFRCKIKLQLRVMLRGKTIFSKIYLYEEKNTFKIHEALDDCLHIILWKILEDIEKVFDKL